ncbi:PDZ domain-containing protein [uncultured Jatrophihabitans sp.]|uniref:YlbL family protein n=1 Tax=uncultured Jatrophihabitans sp. TaxID=1610747 RepID=UPI0035CB233C
MPRRSFPAIDAVPGGAALGSMSRRVRTLIVAGVAFIVLFVLALTMPVPYVILSPGPTYNTLGSYNTGKATQEIIGIDGRTPAKRSGHLNLTTVSVSNDSISAFQAFTGWLAHDQVVVPRSSVYPPGQSEQQTDKQNTADFTASQDNAIAAASCELGYPRRFGITGVLANGAGRAVLKPADVLESVAGRPTASENALRAVLSVEAPGTTVPIRLERAGKQVDTSLKLGPSLQGRKGGSLGITPGTVCAAPFAVDLGLGNEIGGPSAGLMFALGIMDKVGSRDLTQGRFIAGTGTIDASGKVGPIGGIALKMIAARAKGATVFLAPAGNCNDVVGATPAGLKIVRVTSLHGAVTALEQLEQGKSPAGC